MSKYYFVKKNVELYHPKHRVTVKLAKYIKQQVQSGVWDAYSVRDYLKGNLSKKNPKKKWSMSITAYNILEPIIYTNYETNNT